MNIATEIARGTRRATEAGAADLERFRRRLDRGLHDARKEATRRIRATDRYVHGHPWTAVAVAAGLAAFAGVVAAQLLRRDR